METGGNKNYFSSLTLAILIILFSTLIYAAFQPDSNYSKITFFDVGQGDSALIKTNENQRVLIDGGPDNSVLSKLDSEIPFYERRLEAIILSHPHADHLVGLIEVIKTYKVSKIYMSGVLHTTPEYLEFLEIIKDKNIPVQIVKSGDQLKFDEKTKIEFFYPKEELTGQKVENLNNSSIVLKYTDNNSSAIFMGDLEIEGQEELYKTNDNLKSDILKVSHHGSLNGTTNKLIERTKPKYAVISSGKNNKFGHPSAKTVDILNGIKVFRTDKEGDISFRLFENIILEGN